MTRDFAIILLLVTVVILLRAMPAITTQRPRHA
jgi:hypothetical protein